MTWEIVYVSDGVDMYPSKYFEADSYLSAVAQFYECFPGYEIHSVWVKVC